LAQHWTRTSCAAQEVTHVAGEQEQAGPGEYSPYHEGYISKVGGEDILETLRGQAQEMFAFLGQLSEERALFRYAAGKWSVKEVLGHIVDGERVLPTAPSASAGGTPRRSRVSNRMIM